STSRRSSARPGSGRRWADRSGGGLAAASRPGPEGRAGPAGDGAGGADGLRGRRPLPRAADEEDRAGPAAGPVVGELHLAGADERPPVAHAEAKRLVAHPAERDPADADDAKAATRPALEQVRQRGAREGTHLLEDGRGDGGVRVDVQVAGRA